MFTPPPKMLVKPQPRALSNAGFMISYIINYMKPRRSLGVDSSKGFFTILNHLPQPSYMKITPKQNKRHQPPAAQCSTPPTVRAL